MSSFGNSVTKIRCDHFYVFEYLICNQKYLRYLSKFKMSTVISFHGSSCDRLLAGINFCGNRKNTQNPKHFLQIKFSSSSVSFTINYFHFNFFLEFSVSSKEGCHLKKFLMQLLVGYRCDTCTVSQKQNSDFLPSKICKRSDIQFP